MDSDEGIHMQSDEAADAAIPNPDTEQREPEEIGEADPLPGEDVEAEEAENVEEDGLGVPEESQPESQGQDPFEVELGDDGQGDLAPEDL